MRGINQSFPKPLSTGPGAVFVQINGSQVYLGEVVVEGGVTLRVSSTCCNSGQKEGKQRQQSHHLLERAAAQSSTLKGKNKKEKNP